MRKNRNIHPASFRDPAGFVFLEDGVIKRAVSPCFKENYDHLMSSGLYRRLVDRRLLVAHEEIENDSGVCDKVYRIIRPEVVPFISYPYEWCFSQLKGAALATLQALKTALEHGMVLKDASAYNVQLRRNKPVMIDTLSFEKYREGEPWKAYHQFCRHFLAPLALMAFKDVRLNQLLRVYIDGIPLDLASSLLPSGTYLKFSILSHLHLHSRSQKLSGTRLNRAGMSKRALLALADNLENSISGLECRERAGGWSSYYETCNYSAASLRHKEAIVSGYLEALGPKTVWDIGANTGHFSRLSGDRGILTISLDHDHHVIEENYLGCLKRGETNVLPLVLDLTNPSGGAGWENKERASLVERGPADTVLALALMHHMAISNNVPFLRMAEFLARACDSLIIEYVPKSDLQAQRLLASRDDVFDDYTVENFEKSFGQCFRIREAVRIEGSERTMYLMDRRCQR